MIQPPDPASVRLLIAEDDPVIREVILAQFSRERYVVQAAESIAATVAALKRGTFDVLVLDVNFPDGNGIELCKSLRADGYEGAIIIVTARDSSIDRVLGLELGADDYLTKPFEFRELLARVRNILKRVQAPGAPSPAKPKGRIARFGDWRLDLYQRRLISSSERLVILSAAEYRLLCRFIEAPDKVLSREELLPERSVTVAFDRSLDLQISRLRQKLATEAGSDHVILTVRNEGYVLPGPVTFE